MRVGEPFGKKAMEGEAYQHLLPMRLDAYFAKREFEKSNSYCLLDEVELVCEAIRSWLVVWPRAQKNANNIRTERVRALITYRMKVSENKLQSISIEVQFIK
jgi:hypothetical protein